MSGTVIDQLLVQFGADFKDLEKALATAHSQTQGSFGKIQGVLDNAVSGFRRAAGLLGVSLSVAALVQFGRTTIDQVGALGEMAEQAGITTDALQALQFSALQNGLSTEGLQKTVEKLTSTLGEAANGSGTALEAFNRLGVNILDVNGELRTTESILPEVAVKIMSLKSAAEQAAAAKALMGRSAQQALPLLRELAQTGMGGLIDGARAAGAVVDKEIIQRFDEIADKASLWMKKIVVAAAEGIGAWVTIIDQLTAARPLMKDIVDQGKVVLDLRQRLADVEAGKIRNVDLEALNEELRIEREKLGVLQERMALESAPKAASPMAKTDTGVSNPMSDAELKKIDGEVDSLTRKKAALEAEAVAMEKGELAGKLYRAEQELIARLGPMVAGGANEAAYALLYQIAALEKAADAHKLYAAAAQREADLWLDSETKMAQGRAEMERLIQAKGNMEGTTRREIASIDAQIVAMQQSSIVLNRITGQYEIYDRQLQVVIRTQELMRQNILLSEDEARSMAERQVDAQERLRRAQQSQNVELQNQQNNLQELQRFGERAADRIGDAITRMALEGKDGFTDLGNVGRAVASELMQDFFRLAAINPLKNLLFGGNAPTMSGIGGVLGDLFGGGGASSGGAGWIIDGFSSMGMFAAGGRTSGREPIIVGEKGPEIFHPDSAGTVIPNSKMGGGGPQVFIDARGADREGLARVEAQVRQLSGTLEHRAISAVVSARQRRSIGSLA